MQAIRKIAAILAALAIASSISSCQALKYCWDGVTGATQKADTDGEKPPAEADDSGSAPSNPDV